MKVIEKPNQLILKETRWGPKIIGGIFVIVSLLLAYQAQLVNAHYLSKGYLLSYILAFGGVLALFLPSEFHMVIIDRKKGKISVAKRTQVGSKVQIKHYKVDRIASIKVADIEHVMMFGKVGWQYGIVAKSKSGAKYMLTRPFWDYGSARRYQKLIEHFLQGNQQKTLSEEARFIEELIETEELILLVSVEKIEMLDKEEYRGAEAPISSANVHLKTLEVLKGETDREEFIIQRGVEKEEVTSTHTITRFTELYDDSGDISAIGFLGGLFLYFPRYLNKGRLVLVGKKKNYESQKESIADKLKSWPYLVKMIFMLLEKEVGIWERKMSTMEEDVQSEWLTYVRKKLRQK